MEEPKVRLADYQLLDQTANTRTEAWGEDKVLTSHMGVAYASGLSKNGSWSDPDAVAPVMKVCQSETSNEYSLIQY